MGTTRTFNTMLNENLNYDLLKEELVKRSWLLENIEKDDGWKGGTLPVPFKAAGASSVSFGALTGSTDISEDVLVRGSIASQPEVWGSLIFNQRDLMEHDGKVNEKSFLKLLPNSVDDFMSYIKEVVSLSFTNGAAFATAITSEPSAAGVIIVDRPERFNIGQKVQVDDDNSTSSTVYVTAINMNTAAVTFSATRGGAAFDFTAVPGPYTLAQNTKIYFDGAQTNGLTSLKSSLLSLANGGGASLYGQTKASYPYLQSINVSGASISATTILSQIFDAYTVVKNRGKGNPNKAVMSYKNWGTALKQLETSKGAFNIVPQSSKTSVFGWDSVMVNGVKGGLELVAVQEVDDDYIMMLDMRSMKVHSNGMFKKRMSPDGDSYFEVRSTSGYQYIVDMCFFGDLVLNRPSYCGIIHSISY